MRRSVRVARPGVVLLVLALAGLSCSDGGILSPVLNGGARLSTTTTSSAVPAVVISQVYGGGGNSGATLKNDFIELFNPGTAAVSVAGWSVQYASSGGSTWQVTGLSGTIQPGGYYLVRQAAGAGGTVDLPAADASGGIAMAATAGKVRLVSSTTALSGTCPTGTALVDQVSYGTAATNCGFGTTATLTNTTAALRNASGCAHTGSHAADFSTGAPSPRNGSSPTRRCDEPVSVSVAPVTATIDAGTKQQFTATALDASGNAVGTTFTWSSSDTDVATVDASGLASGVTVGTATITATAANGVSGDASLTVGEPPPPPDGDVFLSEIHYDNDGGDTGEAVEVEGPAGLNLAGWTIVLYNGNGGASYATLALTGTLTDQCSGRGVAWVAAPGIQNGAPDGLALVDTGGDVVEFLSYEGTFTAANGPAAGMTSTDIGVDQDPAPAAGRSLQRDALGWYGPATASFGGCNVAPQPSIAITGRQASDAPLPVGFEDQLFASYSDGRGGSTSIAATWSSETPGVASIDANGVMRALAAGTAVLRATAGDGTTGTISLPTRVGAASTSAVYAGNAEFGEPADADASDDFLVRRAQYTASYNRDLGIPNWVSYNLEATHFGAEDRCDCFTFDPELPSDFGRYTTADYTGAGAFAGYGIDRGHLVRSFDRTAGSLDNATTYYFTNIIPQAADNNQGPWAAMESYVGDVARLQNKEVYVVTGPAGSKGTVKNEGKITIPAKTWKVAVLMPRDHGLAHVQSHADLEVIAAIMPNDPGIRNVNWETYKTTVDAIEALVGYDLLALLPDHVETAVESGTKPPTAALDGPYGSAEGSSLAVSAAASSDPDGDALSYAWSFGDGGVATGVTASHTYAQDGGYTVRLIVTDTRGLADTTTTTAQVANVAPAIAAFDGAMLLPGETYSAAGSFTDPGEDSWTASVDYGDGSGVGGLPLAGKTFALSHRYTASGSFTVTVRVTDDDETSSRTQGVSVLTPVQGVQHLLALVDQLVAGGRLNGGNGASLKAQLQAAIGQLERGNPGAAMQQLQSFVNELDALVRAGRLSAADADPLREMALRVIRSISG